MRCPIARLSQHVWVGPFFVRNWNADAGTEGIFIRNACGKFAVIIVADHASFVAADQIGLMRIDVFSRLQQADVCGLAKEALADAQMPAIGLMVRLP